MSQLNLKQVLSGDNLSTVVDKINFNFDQIVLNGGGPQGLRGILGAPGLPGAQGIEGETGPTGEHGTYIFADGASPGIYPFGTGGEALPRIGDIYIETDPTFLNIFELNTTGGTGSYWNLVETVAAPSSSWVSVYDNANPVWDGIGNDSAVSAKVFIGSTSSFGTGSDSNTFFDPNFPANTLKTELSSPLFYSDSVLTVAGPYAQLRILSNSLAGASGAFGGTGTNPDLLFNRGGVVHSLSGVLLGIGGTAQLYRIANADLLGEKFFSLSLNQVGNTLLYGDMNNKAGIGVPEFTALNAQLTVRNSIVVGRSNFYSQSVFLDNRGALIEGNLAVGLTSNQYANTMIHGSTSSTLVVDVDRSSGSPTNISQISISSNYRIPATKNEWKFVVDGYNNVTNKEHYGSLTISGTKDGVGSISSAIYLSLTGGFIFRSPLIGIGNSDPKSLFEVGPGYNRVSIGEGDISSFDYSHSYLGFNIARHPIDMTGTPWVRRGNGSNNAGRTIWSNLDSSAINFSFFGSSGGATATMTDTQVMTDTRLSIDNGQIMASDYLDAHVINAFFGGSTGLGQGILFQATGTTGTSFQSNAFRRNVAVFGGISTPDTVATILSTTNGYIQDYTSSGGNGPSVLPHYGFSIDQTTGLYLAQGTQANSGVFSFIGATYSIGLAIGGTVGISIHGNPGVAETRVGIANRDPYERLHIGEKLVFHDGMVKFFGHNIYWDGSTLTRITGSTAIGGVQEGFVRLAYPEFNLVDTNASLTRFATIGTKYSIEIGSLGGTASGILNWGGLNKVFKGFVISPPLMGPTSTHTNGATYTPQVLIGLNYDTDSQSVNGGDSATSARRGTLALGAQYRGKTIPSPIFEDIYNIGLYSYDGYPSSGIGSYGGIGSAIPTTKFLINFLGQNGDISEDLEILHSETDSTLLNTYTRKSYFGANFRVGINEIPAVIGAPLVNVVPNPFNGACVAYDTASLVVKGVTESGGNFNAIPWINTAGIFKGSLVVDDTGYGTDYSTSFNGLWFKNGGVTGAASKLTAISGESYPGDWAIRYVRTSGVNASSGLSFLNPYMNGFVQHPLWLDDTGNVGMGTNDFSFNTPIPLAYHTGSPGTSTWTNWANGTVKLAVAGGIQSTYIVNTSDKRLKENILELDSSINKIKQLKPVSFTMKDVPGISFGFLAQDVQDLYPEMIRSFNDPKLEGGKLTIEYNSMIAVLAKGMQEQQIMIDEKDAKIKNLENKLSRIEELLEKHNIS